MTTCLRIDPKEKVTLITDRATETIAAALGAQLAQRGCPWNVFVLEDLAARPLIDMPADVLTDLETSQVSIFAVQVEPNELRSRMQMTDVVNRRRMRHAHMVNITPEIMCQGMRADYNLVDRLSQKVLDRVRKAARIRAWRVSVTSRKGGRIHFAITPRTTRKMTSSTTKVPFGMRKFPPLPEFAPAALANSIQQDLRRYFLARTKTNRTMNTRLMKYMASTSPTMMNMMVNKRPWASG